MKETKSTQSPEANSAEASTTEEGTGKSPSKHNVISRPLSPTANRPTKTWQQNQTRNPHCAKSANSTASLEKKLITASHVANLNPSHSKTKICKRETGRRDAGCEFLWLKTIFTTLFFYKRFFSFSNTIILCILIYKFDLCQLQYNSLLIKPANLHT